ncbi:MAG TPA: HIT domain-containing protein [Ktedonosporobacter sp.]|jgi:histidine triad (HIT) family protein|nr:HIT domain-containing protein [Ktedonosporobacter sp.]
MDCIFCEIIAGRAPASFVYQGEQVVAFMSLEQPNPYKVLVVPRAHVETIYDLNAEQAALIFQATVRVAKAIRAISGCAGLNVVQSNGMAGQQDVFHFHIHLLPRFPDDTQRGRILLSWDNAAATRLELDKLAGDLRSQMF